MLAQICKILLIFCHPMTIETKKHNRQSISISYFCWEMGGNSYFLHNESTFPRLFPFTCSIHTSHLFHPSLLKLNFHTPPLIFSLPSRLRLAVLRLSSFHSLHWSLVFRGVLTLCHVLFLFSFFFGSTHESCPQLSNREGRKGKKERKCWIREGI